MSILDLWSIRRELSNFEPSHGVTAKSDPTMLFAGLMWGRRIAVGSGLLKPLWALKPALFQCGDRYVEKVLIKYGLEPFKKDFERFRSADDFYHFGDPLVFDHDDPDLLGWRTGTESCSTLLANLYKESHLQIRHKWIEATNLALESVLISRDWVQAWSQSDGEQLISIAQAEEEQKNVKVVTTLVSGADALPIGRPYKTREEAIIRACSRWFTLLDDALDLHEDWRTAQPNHVVAKMVQEGELDTTLNPKDMEGKSLQEMAPITCEWYADAYDQARQHFLQTFPIFPKLFCRTIEKRAQTEGQSPF